MVASVYLRVEESVSVPPVGRALVESVVAAAGHVHVGVAQCKCKEGAEQKKHPQRRHLFLCEHALTLLCLQTSLNSEKENGREKCW